MRSKKLKEDERRALLSFFLFRIEQAVFLFTVIILGVLFYSILHPAAGFGAQTDYPRAIIFDVGQGDAILLDGGGGEQMLVDGGPDGTVLEKLGRFIPRGDRKIEYVVLTHVHSDHVSGLIDVLERFEVVRIILAEHGTGAPAYHTFMESARNGGAEIIRPKTGAEFMVGEIRVVILGGGEKTKNENNASIVLRAEYKGGSVLLTGDLEAEGEADLVLRGIGRVDALKVAHHGSKTSSTPEFLDALRPDYALISVGLGNGYGHPHPSVISRFKNRGIKIFRTDFDGDVILQFKDDGVIIVQTQTHKP